MAFETTVKLSCAGIATLGVAGIGVPGACAFRDRAPAACAAMIPANARDHQPGSVRVRSATGHFLMMAGSVGERVHSESSPVRFVRLFINRSWGARYAEGSFP